MASITGEHPADQPVMNRIQELVETERRLHGQMESEEDQARLREVQLALDQAWDLLRQRRALRTSGQDPDKAQVRPAQVVEKYEQ